MSERDETRINERKKRNLATVLTKEAFIYMPFSFCSIAIATYMMHAVPTSSVSSASGMQNNSDLISIVCVVFWKADTRNVLNHFHFVETKERRRE